MWRIRPHIYFLKHLIKSNIRENQLEEMIPTLSMVVVKTLDNDMFNSTNGDYITYNQYKILTIG